ncbi:MAG TPA: glycosyltransferase [Gemmatimonadales bacterium]|nr:glycosyltransferase [Gemmatimonadales bacterium]
MRRILHVASGREWRGGQRQVLLLARALSSEPDLHQTVVTSRHSELERRLQSARVSVESVPWTAGLDPRVILPLLRASRGGSRPILHAHDSHALALAALCARWTGAPLVATRRVDFPLRRPWPWRQANRVIAISHAVREVLIASGIAPDRIAVIHSGIDVHSTLGTRPLGIRESLDFGAECRIAVNVAALVGHKDHKTLVETARLLRPRLPNLRWVIAGDGPLREKIQAKVAEAGLRGVVHLLGTIPDGVSLIADADVFVMSSSEEGLGTSVLDAMALGVPVVTTNAGGLPELVGSQAAVICSKGKPDQLAAAVERILADPVERERLTTAGRTRTAAFSHERMASEHLPVYRSLDSDA